MEYTLLYVNRYASTQPNIINQRFDWNISHNLIIIGDTVMDIEFQPARNLAKYIIPSFE